MRFLARTFDSVFGMILLGNTFGESSSQLALIHQR
jgi:hypothetical protein